MSYEVFAMGFCILTSIICILGATYYKGKGDESQVVFFSLTFFLNLTLAILNAIKI